jgi:UPF0755 protein
MYIKRIILAVVFLGLIVMAIFSYFVYVNVFVPNTSFNNEEAHIYLPSGANFSMVVDEIKPLLKDIETFENVAKRKKYVNNVKPGHYIITKGMNNNDIINAIRSNNVAIKIKFNNLERLEDLAGLLSKQMEVDSISLIKAFKDSTFITKNNFTIDNVLSMYIPNTYEIYWNTSAEDFRDKMFTENKRFWTEDRLNKSKELGLTKEQIVSLAAIVQKETSKVDERSKIAGVYINRIELGMPLQADPTVIYAKKLVENNFDQEIKRVLYRDLVIDSPYNTYKYSGIPPGPITMPDISSIDAVLNFEDHDFLYFVADVNRLGYHKFATNLSQHNRNRREYIQWISKQRINR